MADKTSSGAVAAAASRRAPLRTWRRAFLGELAATSNVSAAARKVGISTARAYEARRDDAEFYREWQEALCEGYDHLEMTLLQRLREGEVKPAAGGKRGARVFDNATALRLLVAHRESAARQRAITENRNAASILSAIDAKIDRMRERALAAPDAATTNAGTPDTATPDATIGQDGETA